MGYVMRSTARNVLGRIILACTAMLLTEATFAPTLQAQTTAPVKPAKGHKAAAPQGEAQKPDPAAAERAMDAGIKDYEAGKYDAAVQTLSSAMQGGALPGTRVARALYFRGSAYRKLGKPAQAISDLTSALWLKGGLSETERSDALAQRDAAYKEAGIESAPAVASSVGKAPPAVSNAATAAPQASAIAAPAQPASQQVAAIAPSPPAASAEGSSGITGFFGGLFGGSSGAPPPASAGAAATTTTGTISPPPEPVASSWSSTTQASTGVRPTPTAPAVQAATPTKSATKLAAASPAAVAPAPAVASGRFRLQVAAVRSREEADKVLTRLKKEFAKKMGGREALVDEAVIGNMGTFYRVRIGPYASANEPRQLCITLRASAGFDCLVVTQ